MAMFPALSSEIAQLIVRDRAFYSRARTSVKKTTKVFCWLIFTTGYFTYL